MEPNDLNDPQLRDRAVRAALGQEPFDVLIANGRVADMVTGQLRHADVGLVGPLIASVHPTATRADAHDVVSAENYIVAPGLIDMHMHIESSMVGPQAYSDIVVPRGVTTVVWDPHELGNTCAMEGIDFAIKASSQTALRTLVLAPSCVPSAPGFETTGAAFTADTIERLLQNPDIHGVAEVMSMQALLDRDKRMSGIVQAGLDSVKRVCGHARGLSGARLNAYVAAGIETDHELTSAEDLQNKLEAGLTIEMRGSHDHLLPQFVAVLRQLSHLPQTVTLCTDDVFVDDLTDAGGLNDVVRRLVGYGLDPLWAMQAATLNAASRLGRSDLGLVAPGKRADLVLFEDFNHFSAQSVFIDGLRVADNGVMRRQQKPLPVPQVMRNTAKMNHHSADDFRVPSGDRSVGGKTVSVATIEKPRFTEWGRRQASTENGFIVCPDDTILMAIINRFGAYTKPRIAYLGQWGQWNGAFATTVSHDSHNLTLFGSSESDMAVAANRVTDLGGGLAVVSNGSVLAELALPVAGLISEEPVQHIAEGFRQIRAAMDSVVKWEPPYLVFKACFGASLVCNAGPHLSDVGIVDTERNIVLDNPSDTSGLQYL